jgi:WD40-like Beta Propeller Repeat
MTTAISLAELRAADVSVTPQEAVAIVQSLIHSDLGAAATEPPFGPPTLDTVAIDADGAVCSRGCATTPAVYELGILLHSLLEGVSRVPGGLRYAIGRALLEVDAPPFDSLGEFSRGLERFEQGDRVAVVRAIFARAEAVRPAAAAATALVLARPAPAVVAGSTARVERRRSGASTSELRRQLRDMDRQLFEQRPVAAASGAGTEGSTGRWRRAPLAAGLAAGLALVAFGEYLHQRSVSHAGTSVATAVVRPADNESSTTRPSTPVPPAALNPPISAVEAARPSTDVELAPSRTVRGSRRAAPANLSDRSPVHPQGDAIVVQSVDSEQRPVFSPAFASNGTAMFFHTGKTGDARSALVSLDGASNDLRVMTIVDDGSRNYHVQPSPDGRSIAFDSDRDGERGVYIANRDGTNVHRVSGSGYAAVPSWSPDAARLAFIRAEPENSRVWNLWLLTLDSGEIVRLTSFQYGQTWSASWFPDGRRICYTHEDRLIVQNLADGGVKEYPSPVKSHLVRTPAVSPDGTKVVFQVYRSGAWLLDLKDGSVRCVLTDPTAEEFAWAPDGRRVAFHSRRDGQWGIWMMSGI